MKRYFTLSVFLFAFIANSIAQKKPDWLDRSVRRAQYPDSQYVVGFSSDVNRTNLPQEDFLNTLTGYSRTSLVESIHVTINSISTLNVANMNAKTHEEFKQVSTSYSKMAISGLKSEIFYDDRKDEGFVLTYALKNDLVDQYKRNIEKHAETIYRKADEGASFLEKGNKQFALKSYYETLPMFRELEQNQTILMALSPTSYDGNSALFSKLNEYKVKVKANIADLQSSKDLSLNDFCYMLAKAYGIQTQALTGKIYLTNFTYQDTKIASSFSRRLRTTLEQKLIDVADYAVTTEDITPELKKEIKYVLKGTFWEEGDDVRVISYLRSGETGKPVASMEGVMSKATLEKIGVLVQPPNLNQALENKATFAQGALSNNDGLLVEAWTNKGSSDLVYDEGELLRIFVRVNKACYVRVVYHMADGSQVLLVDNYFIDSNKANKVYEIPEEFECAEPFGIEMMQVNAQSIQFDKLNTHKQWGYEFIDDKFEDVVGLTRGFKKVETVLKAETNLTITTMSK